MGHRTLSVQKLIGSIEKKKSLPEFSLLDPMQMLDVASGKAETETMYNCLAKAGFQRKSVLAKCG